MYDLTKTYDAKFFQDNNEDSGPVAKYLAPKIKNAFKVKSVIDYGCAAGHWLSQYQTWGVEVLGVEGSQSIVGSLKISPKHIMMADLRKPLLQEDKKLKTFLETRHALGPTHLAQCIEVAEHVEEEYANQLVANIVSTNPDVIIMTAAPPGQGGLGHVNEQPKSYWYTKFMNLGWDPDPPSECMIAMLIEYGRREPVTDSELQRPDMERVCPLYPETRGCEKGVWIPHWFGKNLMIMKKRT